MVVMASRWVGDWGSGCVCVGCGSGGGGSGSDDDDGGDSDAYVSVQVLTCSPKKTIACDRTYSGFHSFQICKIKEIFNI